MAVGYAPQPIPPFYIPTITVGETYRQHQPNDARPSDGEHLKSLVGKEKT